MESYHQLLNAKDCSCSPEIRRTIVRNLPFLKNVSATTLEHMQKNLHSRGIREGIEISPLQYPNGLLGVVANGALKVLRHVQEDQVVVFDVLTAGDFFLYSPSDLEGLRMYTYPDILQAMTTTCTLAMDQTKFLPLLTQDSQLAASFFAHLAERLRQANERFIRCSAYQAEHRLAYLLRYLLTKGPAKTEHPGLIPFNLPRKDLAAMAGLTMETTSRILSGMERDGLIRSGRGWVEVLEPEGLDALCRAEVL